VTPSSVVEPTCGLGRFVLAALDQFPAADALGFEINPDHVEALRMALAARPDGRGRVIRFSFFDVDWASTLRELPEPILLLGNPPWVTNAELGTLGSANLPPKSNREGLVGLDALTGKSNFDISEWMLVRLLEAMAGRRGWLAMLCKTTVARKILRHAWKDGVALEWAELREIDARAWFGAAVDACLLVCGVSTAGANRSCGVFPSFEAERPQRVFGFRDGRVVADIETYTRWKHLAGESPQRWRSGVKHDASKVMELRRDGARYRNGFGERVELEDDFLFPMLKSSEVAKECVEPPTRWMLVPQRTVGDDPESTRSAAPRTWQYLWDHREVLDRRGSSIYRNRPRFSVFGVGPYTFEPWKVAISGFYKRLGFVAVGPFETRPVVFDDTVYFTACRTEAEARLVASLLNSEVAREFFGAFIFWDAKRPITTELLHRLDLDALTKELGLELDLSWRQGKDTPRSLASTRKKNDCID
jgi:hypothetical protein